jgi:hypothetical protein
MPPTSDAALVNSSTTFGNTAAVDIAIAAPPLPLTALTALGLLVKSDLTSAAARTTHLGLVPTTSATATAQLLPGVNGTTEGSPVGGLTLTAKGSGYVAPPVVQFTGGAGTVSASEGIEIPLVSAAGVAFLDVLSVTVTGTGSGYTAPVVSFVGGLSLNGRTPGVAATATATVGGGGAITGIVVTSPGSGYTSPPTVIVTDPTGTLATFTAVMAVGSLLLTRAGRGYVSPPTVTLVPLFKAFFPDGPNQAAPLKNLLTTGIRVGALTSIQAAPPVLT